MEEAPQQTETVREIQEGGEPQPPEELKNDNIQNAE